jgi:serine protease Do
VAGVQPGDVILRFNERVVPSMRDLPRMVAESPVGDSAKVTLWRKGEEVAVDVLLGRLEEGEVIDAAAPGPKQDEAPAGAALTAFGMTMEPLTEARRTELDIAPDVTGVVVARVDQAGHAAEKGIRPGDVIVEVGQEPVSAPEDVTARLDAIAKDGRGSALFLLQSGGELRFVALSLASR